eukprot:TRINITY_DN7138_c0_g1_i1.p1 TRINITY_DN7138_c0_g1~~TRINITY_DN7138_c0_g1_i1.p1  ORF type:complete len:257 (-),score=61.87 TRINITY_DN7138_c0_g1_i1:23-793(-)
MRNLSGCVFSRSLSFVLCSPAASFLSKSSQTLHNFPISSRQFSSFSFFQPVTTSANFSLCFARHNGLQTWTTENAKELTEILKSMEASGSEAEIVKVRARLMESATPYIYELADQIVELDPREGVQLLGLLAIKLGIDPTEALTSGFGGGGGGGGARGGSGGAEPAASAPEPEKKADAKPAAPAEPALVKLRLKSVGDQKFKILKEIRALRPELQLVETKGLIDNLPSTLKDGLTPEEGKKWAEKFKEAGGEVELV